jgi:hypothetical protein
MRSSTVTDVLRRNRNWKTCLSLCAQSGAIDFFDPLVDFLLETRAEREIVALLVAGSARGKYADGLKQAGLVRWLECMGKQTQAIEVRGLKSSQSLGKIARLRDLARRMLSCSWIAAGKIYRWIYVPDSEMKYDPYWLDEAMSVYGHRRGDFEPLQVFSLPKKKQKLIAYPITPDSLIPPEESFNRHSSPARAS